METGPITLSTYRIVFLQSESSVLAPFRLFRDFAFRRGLYSRAAMVFIITTTIWIWVFPSFASSMTGYSSNVKAYIQVDGDYVAFGSFCRIMFVIHDGWRIDKGGEHVVPFQQYFGEFY
jgi:hypothetical protein